MTLSPDHFPAFFQEVYGYEPFPWQTRLLQLVAETGGWPAVLDLPTGSGKTAAIDVAVFHLALEADRGSERRAPVRIAFVVDRRLVVDDAFTRAKTLAKKLLEGEGPITAQVAERMKGLSSDGPPLIARRLRGGIPRESDWARTPSQPTVLCSTVDQVGSRLLFRGYGVSDRMKPLHAGLIGSDCLILLDEAHLAEPFRQTLDWIRTYRGTNWRERGFAGPWGVALLTATPGEMPQAPFALSDEDCTHPVLRKRLEAPKPARLFAPQSAKASVQEAAEASSEAPAGDQADRARVMVEKVNAALAHFRNLGDGCPAVGVVVNRVARAREVHKHLEGEFGKDEAAAATLLLLIGPARPVDRDALAEQLALIKTGTERVLDRPLIVVATQCIEAGVDIDLDALITEAAPLDALRQRFGRLNRAGRDIEPYAAVVAAKGDFAKDDPVYGDAIKPSWERLKAASSKLAGEEIVDFGISALKVEMLPEVLSPKDDAPVLLPAHLDLLSQTSPIPSADPDVALYLHGSGRQPDSISVVWRADIDDERPRDDGCVRHLLTLVPPRSGEAIELPIWAVHRWLLDNRDPQDSLADTASRVTEDDEQRPADRRGRCAFLWKGNDERSRWITASELRPGDSIVVPAAYGGVDVFGWDPARREPAIDVAQAAAAPFAGRTFAVRVAPGLLGDAVSDDAIADAVASAVSRSWCDLRAALRTLNLPDDLRNDLGRLGSAKGRAPRVVPYTDLYGDDADGRPRGVVFVAPFGISDADGATFGPDAGIANTTEDDDIGSTPGFSLGLAQHSQDVETKAAWFAEAAGLPKERVADLKLAGWLHDAGKADPRFQAWMHHGDPLGPDLDRAEQVLAKSDRPLPRSARDRSGLPDHWRHEALSVRLAPLVARFADAMDPELVLWLLGTHHGYGRPLFPHADPDDAEARKLPPVLDLPPELPAGFGPQSLAFDWKGHDWPSLFTKLKERYGVWELARMEAILRLADHRASEEARRKEVPEDKP